MDCETLIPAEELSQIATMRDLRLAVSKAETLVEDIKTQINPILVTFGAVVYAREKDNPVWGKGCIDNLVIDVEDVVAQLQSFGEGISEIHQRICLGDPKELV